MPRFLLVFASNTALIGSYHVFLALSRVGFLPKLLTQRNAWRQTPQWAILVATAIPVLVLVLTQGSVTVLGDLYAFGLLGAFSLTCASLDIVRWHERHHAVPAADQQGDRESTAPPAHRIGRATFGLGLLTTALVTLAWSVNLVAKPLATLFGGGVTLSGLVIGVITYRLRRRQGIAPALPLVHHRDYPAVFLQGGRLARPAATVLAVLPAQPADLSAMVEAAEAVTASDPIVFLYRGRGMPRARAPELFEVVNPYLDDQAAQAAFAAADTLALAHGRVHRYLYLPASADGAEAVARFWRRLQPKETLVVADDADLLAVLPAHSAQRREEDLVPILHYELSTPGHTGG